MQQDANTIRRQEIVQRISARAKALGLTVAEAEMRAFGSVGRVRNWTRKDKNVLPRIDTLEKLATALQTTGTWLLNGDNAALAQPESDIVTHQAPALPSRQEMHIDVPVMGTAAGSHLRGAFELESGIIDYVRRPPALAGAKDLYALFVEGTSMEPQYFPGDLIYISPHRPCRLGDIVVVQCKNGDHEPTEATLGILRKQTESSVTIGKRNPVADIQIRRDTVKAIHKVLTTNELFGV